MENLVKYLMVYQINKAIANIGIENTLKTIESISTPILRAKLRIEFLKILKERLEKS